MVVKTSMKQSLGDAQSVISVCDKTCKEVFYVEKKKEYIVVEMKKYGTFVELRKFNMKCYFSCVSHKRHKDYLFYNVLPCVAVLKMY